ncbi:MAG: hypothetical protein KI790_12330 [Cyclobacteriaceae bacterium]|nr:hypothetical protein [Cyclobacteriaceae bacterium HetDA_MAG_MS6]
MPLVILLIAWPHMAKCQLAADDINSLSEELAFHINDNVFVTGEHMLVSYQCLNTSGDVSTISQVAYFELLDDSNRPVLQQKCVLKDGKGSTDIFLTRDLRSGIYTLIGYTRWMQNFSLKSIWQRSIVVHNPFRMLPSALFTSDTICKSEVTNPQYLEIAFENSTLPANNKSNVTLTVPSELVGDLVTVSVKKKSHLCIQNPIDIGKAQLLELSIEDIQYLPDYRGYLLSGQILDKGDVQLAGEQITLSFPGQPFSHQVTITDSAGFFYFNVPVIDMNRDFVVNVRNGLRFKIQDSFLEDHTFVSADQCKISEKSKTWLLQRSIESQIESAYREDERSIDNVIDQSMRPTFLKEPTTYLMDDYTRFPSMEDAIREFVQEVWVRKINDSAALLVPYLNNKSMDVGPALVMLNGIVVPAKVILQWKAADIESINVYSSQVRMGAHEYQGVIGFWTYSKSERLDQLPSTYRYFSGSTQPSRKLANVTDDQLKNERVPDFRQQLYWDAQLLLEKETTVEFYTSDNPGEYVVEIIGTNKGKFGLLATGTFEVVGESTE